MSFGLLWSPHNCLSCVDLTQVHADHNETIRLAFDYLGYDFEVIDRTEGDPDLLGRMTVASIDRRAPVLAFGIIGPPECGIVCGYDGDALVGWSHFTEPDGQTEDGMFSTTAWRDTLEKIVLCRQRKPRVTDLAGIVRRGLRIMQTQEVGGYLAGDAAYDAWGTRRTSRWTTTGCGSGTGCTTSSSATTPRHGRTWPRSSPTGPTTTKAPDRAAQLFMEIHDTCWKVWAVLGGLHAPDGHRGLRDPAKRAELARLLARMKDLDHEAAAALSTCKALINDV